VELAGNSQRANFGWAWQENGDSSGAQIWVSEVWPCSGGGTCQAYDLYDKPAVNTSHTFTVLVSLSDLGLITFQYDGTTADTEYGPALFLPYIGNISGMINSLSDQMPGSIANPANYNQPFIYDGNLQRWVHFNGTASNTSSTYFGNSIVYDMSGNQVDGLTWDKNCSS